MALFGHNWLNSNADRPYPLDGSATATGDAGNLLQHDMLVDARIRFPESLGHRLFLSGITITDNIVTAIFLACNEHLSPSSYTPACSVTLTQPVDRHRAYPVEPMYPGVGGVVVFGDTAEPQAFRFSTAQQGLLHPDAAQSYPALPIQSMGKLGHPNPYTGIVTIAAGNDISIEKGTVEVDDVDRVAMVIKLANPVTNSDNVLQDYVGPCGTRPESGTCTQTAIETIGGVSPDCDGNIEIVFPDGDMGPYQNCGNDNAGVTVDVNINLDDVCDGGSQRDEFVGENICVESSSSASIEPVSSSSMNPPASSESSVATSSSSCPTLPFIDCFNGELDSSWKLKSGSSIFIPSDDTQTECQVPIICSSSESRSSSLSSTSSCSSGSLDCQLVPRYFEDGWRTVNYQCGATNGQALRLDNPSRRNLLIWQNSGHPCGPPNSHSKKVRAHVKVTNLAVNQNAGVVLNYHNAAAPFSTNIEYFIVQINRSTNRAELLRFNGSITVLETFVISARPFSLNDWFNITVEATPSGANTLIAANISNVSDVTWPALSFNYITSDWGNPDGYYGIHANRARADFSLWEIDNV